MELRFLTIPDIPRSEPKRKPLKKMKDFRSLEVWKQSHQLVLNIYQQTESLPKSELFGLTSQIRRAATSIPTNTAEGCALAAEPDLVPFLNIATGSTSKLEYILQL